MLIEGRRVGVVVVRERYPGKVWGVFVAEPGLDPYRDAFETARRLSGEFDVAMASGGDDPLWDRLMAAYRAIGELRPVLAGVPGEIEEFAIDADWSVEITFHPE